MTFFNFKGKRTTVIKKLFSGVEFREMGSFCGQPILALGLFSSVLGYITFYEEYETSLIYFPSLPSCDVNWPCL